MSKFLIEPHFRLHEWVAREKGYFEEEGLDYEFMDQATKKDAQAHHIGDKRGAYQTFEDGRWYAIHLRVTRRIEAWIDGDQVVDLDRLGREFSIWPEQDPARPFGIATYFTKATIRNLQVRRLIEM